MRRNATLADAGPLIALLDEDDPHHQWCIDALQTLTPPLITTWPVIAEAMYCLHKAGGITAQQLLWGYINDGLLEIAELDAERRLVAQQYMTDYADRPCDLADASLLALGETLLARRVLSIDGDFYIYVLLDGSVMDVVPGPKGKQNTR